ncbi:MAG: tyrosine-type recombinase/integrase [Candidatus Dormibacteria bacterium]
MTRRGNGEGSIYRVEGGWRACLMVAGERVYLRGRTQREVADKLLLARQPGGVEPRPRRVSLARFADEWLTSVRPALRPRTWERYRQLLEGHALPFLGRLALTDLRPYHLQQLYQDRLATGLSPTTVRHLHTVLHTLLERGVRWELVPRNVARLVDPPRAVANEMRFFDREQAQRFLDAVAGDPMEGLYVLALTTGLRQGELFALRWKDVDLERGVIAVTGSAQRSPEGLSIAEPKTARSRRQVICSQLALRALRRHRAWQDAQRIEAGSIWTEHGLVFPNRAGGLMEGQNLLRRSFYPLLAAAGLPRIRFHDLRHTAATLLLAEGVHPRIAADLLGHSSPQLVLERYAHATGAMHREAALAMDSLLHDGERPFRARAAARVLRNAPPSAGIAATIAASKALGRVLPWPSPEGDPPVDLKKLVPPEGLEPPTRGLGNPFNRE